MYIRLGLNSPVVTRVVSSTTETRIDALFRAGQHLDVPSHIVPSQMKKS